LDDGVKQTAAATGQDMTDQPLLRRKIVRRQPPPADGPAGSAPARALPRAVGRALDRATGLTARAGSVTESRLKLDEVTELLPDDGFVGLLTPGPGGDGGGCGLVAMDAGLFAALIEALTMGRLSERPPPPRRPTPTDSALLATVVDEALAGLAGLVTAEGGGGAGQSVPSWCLSRGIADLRLLAALLDEGSYTRLHLPLTLGAGSAVRSGALTLLWPEASPQPEARSGPRPAAGGTGPVRPGGDAAPEGLTERVMSAPAQLNTVLGRLVLPLAEVLSLAPGRCFELPVGQLEEIELIGLDGRCQALGRLGQTRGMRALRLVSITDPGGGTSRPPAPGSCALPESFPLAPPGRSGVDLD